MNSILGQITTAVVNSMLGGNSTKKTDGNGSTGGPQNGTSQTSSAATAGGQTNGRTKEDFSKDLYKSDFMYGLADKGQEKQYSSWKDGKPDLFTFLTALNQTQPISQSQFELRWSRWPRTIFFAKNITIPGVSVNTIDINHAGFTIQIPTHVTYENTDITLRIIADKEGFHYYDMRSMVMQTGHPLVAGDTRSTIGNQFGINVDEDILDIRLRNKPTDGTHHHWIVHNFRPIGIGEIELSHDSGSFVEFDLNGTFTHISYDCGRDDTDSGGKTTITGNSESGSSSDSSGVASTPKEEDTPNSGETETPPAEKQEQEKQNQEQGEQGAGGGGGGGGGGDEQKPEDEETQDPTVPSEGEDPLPTKTDKEAYAIMEQTGKSYLSKAEFDNLRQKVADENPGIPDDTVTSWVKCSQEAAQKVWMDKYATKVPENNGEGQQQQQQEKSARRGKRETDEKKMLIMNGARGALVDLDTDRAIIERDDDGRLQEWEYLIECVRYNYGIEDEELRVFIVPEDEIARYENRQVRLAKLSLPGRFGLCKTPVKNRKATVENIELEAPDVEYAIEDSVQDGDHMKRSIF